MKRNIFLITYIDEGVFMTRKLFSLIALIGLGFSMQVHAGAKSDFINAVKKHCGKSDGDAAALATPGRAGNVIKLKTCSGSTVQVAPDCSLPCKDASSSIGG
jgi:hypothetical protein